MASLLICKAECWLVLAQECATAQRTDNSVIDLSPASNLPASRTAGGCLSRHPTHASPHKVPSRPMTAANVCFSLLPPGHGCVAALLKAALAPPLSRSLLPMF